MYNVHIVSNPAGKFFRGYNAFYDSACGHPCGGLRRLAVLPSHESGTREHSGEPLLLRLPRVVLHPVPGAQLRDEDELTWNQPGSVRGWGGLRSLLLLLGSRMLGKTEGATRDVGACS